MQTGIDLIEIERFKSIAESEARMSSLFTEKEIKYFKNFKDILPHVAGSFAAKEAVVKAFKTGFNASITPLDIEILHDENVPYVNLKKGARAFFEEKKFSQIEISISHSKRDAVAICIII